MTVKLRGQHEDFFVQMSPSFLSTVGTLRAFINRRIMIPNKDVEDKEIADAPMDDLLEELANLNMGDKVATLTSELQFPALLGLGTHETQVKDWDPDDGMRSLLDLCRELRPGTQEQQPGLKKLWENPLVRQSTVAARSSMVINRNAMRSLSERTVYRIPT